MGTSPLGYLYNIGVATSTSNGWNFQVYQSQNREPICHWSLQLQADQPCGNLQTFNLSNLDQFLLWHLLVPDLEKKTRSGLHKPIWVGGFHLQARA